MKAWVIQKGFGLDNLAIVDRPVPVPGPGEVLVRVLAVSLNYRDLLITKGMYNPRLSMPRVVCSDAAGVVEAVGQGVTNWNKGDRVLGCFMPGWEAGALTEKASKSALAGDVDGVLAEYVVLPATGIVATPKHLTDIQAATLPCAGVTAWNALTTGFDGKGKTVLLLGTGGVSMFALQFAKSLGARVLITSGSDEKLAKAISLGADAGVNSKQTPDWEKWARNETGGEGVDLVVEVGGAGTLERSAKAVRHGGQIALVGVLAGGVGFNPIQAMMKGVTIRGIHVGSREMFEKMNSLLESEAIIPVVDKVFSFKDATKAFEYLDAAGHVGKVVVAL